MNEESKQFKFFLEEKLKERGIDLKRLADLSGITPNNLKNLINEDFTNLPAAPYIRGYLLKLGKILNFNGEEWWEYFKNKKTIKSSGEKDELPKNRFAVSSTTKYFLIGIIVLLILTYIVFRFNNILGKPTIELNITSSIVKTNNQYFIIEGVTHNALRVLINSEEITLNQNGSFNKEIMLDPGINTLEIKAINILGKETKILRQILYQPEPISQ